MPTGSAPTPSQVVKHYFDTFFSGDIEKALDCLTNDVVWKVQGAPEVPTIGVRHGKQQVREWFALFPTNFQPIEFKIEHFFDSGDQAVLTGRVEHRILSTGENFESDFAIECTVRDGKISSYNFIEDSYGLWRAFQPV